MLCRVGTPSLRERVDWCLISDLVLSPLYLLPLLSPQPTMVLLVTSDNEQFVVDKDVAERSVLIKNMLEGKSQPLPGHSPNPIP